MPYSHRPFCSTGYSYCQVIGSYLRYNRQQPPKTVFFATRKQEPLKIKIMYQHTCTTVSLLRRPITNGRISLYLDFYPAIRNPETMKMTRREYLGIYIYAKPANDIERDFNRQMLEKAEAIRCLRVTSLINEQFDFLDRDKMRGDFLAYFKKMCRKNMKSGTPCTAISITMWEVAAPSATSRSNCAKASGSICSRRTNCG